MPPRAPAHRPPRARSTTGPLVFILVVILAIVAGLAPGELSQVFEEAPDQKTVLRMSARWRQSQVTTAVNKACPKSSEDEFLKTAVVGDPRKPVLSGLAPDQSLEGLLFPDTYFFK